MHCRLLLQASRCQENSLGRKTEWPTCIGCDVTAGVIDLDFVHRKGALLLRQGLSQGIGCHLHAWYRQAWTHVYGATELGISLAITCSKQLGPPHVPSAMHMWYTAVHGWCGIARG